MEISRQDFEVDFQYCELFFKEVFYIGVNKRGIVVLLEKSAVFLPILALSFSKTPKGEGSVPYILSRTRIKIGGVETPVRIGWASIEEVPLILGRVDVFQSFSVEFREFENKIVLKHQTEFA